MLTLKEFMNALMTADTYCGQKILRREIGYGANPDVYLFYGDRSHHRYSCFDEYEKYKDAWTTINERFGFLG